ncbi:hypothetical protein XM38_045960 [Halomicronema hongdechloris C2206]|uniref:Uncharacterized protein n=1 Tax=Halomicronema hongdechloris C2206 TaxID=1641165 RepID=A0A1Z3HTL7_9CYAN|nr:hypothetical protein [Halomicronema hongdechloris]ASC73625.1 hypothetical protein XM38_045960 [Halomicronema hongdechloris C2206]
MHQIRTYFIGMMVLASGIIIYNLWHFLLFTAVFGVTLYLCTVVAHKMKQNSFGYSRAVLVPLAVAFTGVSLGIALCGSPMLIPVGGFPLLSLIIYPKVQHWRLVANYKRNAPYLIQP